VISVIYFLISFEFLLFWGSNFIILKNVKKPLKNVKKPLKNVKKPLKNVKKPLKNS